MKIKLAILDSDSGYIQRVVPIFNNKFAKELEIYSFTEIEPALECLSEKKIDVFLAASSFRPDADKIPKKCGFAYLVDSLDIDRIDNYRAICKFQKAEIIYKQVLNIFSEQVPNITGIQSNENDAMKTIVFSSPVGGVGTSTLAAACAISLASKGYRTLYVNCQVYGEAEKYFTCDGQFDFSDVIYAVKSNKTNRAMKLQSTLKQSETGVYYYSSVKIALDMMEMTSQDYLVLQNEFKALGCFDYVVMDMDFPRTQGEFKFFESCNSIVVVSDTTEIAEEKIEKAIASIQILDGQADFAIQPRMWLINNKQIASVMPCHDIRNLGSFPMYQAVAPSQMARQLAVSNNFDNLI